jgi:hypothetical protein
MSEGGATLSERFSEFPCRWLGTILIHPQSRVTFTAILDLAHSTLDPPRVTSTAILNLAHSTLDSLLLLSQQPEETWPIRSIGPATTQSLDKSNLVLGWKFPYKECTIQ